MCSQGKHVVCFGVVGTVNYKIKWGMKGKEPWGEIEMAKVGGALDDHLYTTV